MVAVAAGLGGGYLAANIVSPPTQAVSKLERSVGSRKTSPEPTTVARAAAEPVPYIAPNDVKDVTSPAVTPAPPQIEAQPQQPPSQLPVQTEAAAPANNPASEEKTAEGAAPSPPAQPPVQPPSPKVVDAKPAEKPEQRSVSPRDSYAKAADAEVKRAAAERRRAERRQQAAERRQQQQPSREQDLDVVEARIREVTEPRRMRGRDEAEARDFAGPARSESPRIWLFDLDD